MSLRREISLALQKAIQELLDEERSSEQRWFEGVGYVYFKLRDQMLFREVDVRVSQQRPYTTVVLLTKIVPFDEAEKFIGVGNSKVCGSVNGRWLDEWDAEQGVKLALARAATNLGAEIAETLSAAESLGVLDEDFSVALGPKSD